MSHQPRSAPGTRARESTGASRATCLGIGIPLRSLPVGSDRAYLDRAAEMSVRDPCGEPDRGVEVVGLEDEVAADGAAVSEEGAVAGLRLAVLHAHRGCL